MSATRYLKTYFNTNMVQVAKRPRRSLIWVETNRVRLRGKKGHRKAFRIKERFVFDFSSFKKGIR